MKVKKLGSWISILAIMGLTLTACGSNKETKSNDAEGAKQVTIKIMSVSQTENPDGPAELEMAERYMKLHPEVKIEFIGVPMNDLYKKVTAMATAGDLPDAFTNTPQFIRTAYGMNITTDLTKLLGEDYLKAFYPNILEESSVDGKLQLLPWTAAPMALVYRGDWFEAEGLKAPENWDEFLDAAKKLTKDTNGDGKADQWGFGMIGTRNGSGADRFMTVLRSYGVDELKKDDSGKWITQLDTPEAKEAFQFYVDLNNKHGVVPPGVTETGFPEAASLMATGKVAMMLTGPNALGNIISQNPDLKGKLYSTPIPMKVKHTATFGVLGYSIAETSQHKEVVADYLKFMVNPENALAWNTVSGRLPTTIEVGKQQQMSTPEYAGFVKALEYAFSIPAFDQYSQFQDIIAEAYQSMIAGNQSVEQATKRATNRANEVIKNNK
ncbi:ABC transporter substrate-binding protein [Cohnella abietis]|uniref:Sugar ABC transporter substrate-binding protein n=1 Tax=Cohnella abietis TaxID=2507935 RepID=A0A3T1DEC3_9BACL|nr:sugar ABC transporter substrate-binding protein [Cohnella abietis]BBI36457.1 sugar ABC transporter substrate-binding protein [Cohnella abietis]